MSNEKVIKLGLTRDQARKIITQTALDSSKVFFTAHAREQMKDRKIH